MRHDVMAESARLLLASSLMDLVTAASCDRIFKAVKQVQARRRFFDAGRYSFVAEELGHLIMDLTGNCSEVSFIACRYRLYCQSHVSHERVTPEFDTPDLLVLLDVGCGLW